MDEPDQASTSAKRALLRAALLSGVLCPTLLGILAWRGFLASMGISAREGTYWFVLSALLGLATLPLTPMERRAGAPGSPRWTHTVWALLAGVLVLVCGALADVQALYAHLVLARGAAPSDAIEQAYHYGWLLLRRPGHLAWLGGYGAVAACLLLVRLRGLGLRWQFAATLGVAVVSSTALWLLAVGRAPPQWRGDWIAAGLAGTTALTLPPIFGWTDGPPRSPGARGGAA